MKATIVREYEVEGEKFNELAKAEIKVRQMLKSGEKEVFIYLNGKLFSVWRKTKSGELDCHKF